MVNGVVIKTATHATMDHVYLDSRICSSCYHGTFDCLCSLDAMVPGGVILYSTPYPCESGTQGGPSREGDEHDGTEAVVGHDNA